MQFHTKREITHHQAFQKFLIHNYVAGLAFSLNLFERSNSFSKETKLDKKFSKLRLNHVRKFSFSLPLQGPFDESVILSKIKSIKSLESISIQENPIRNLSIPTLQSLSKLLEKYPNLRIIQIGSLSLNEQVGDFGKVLSKIQGT